MTSHSYFHIKSSDSVYLTIYCPLCFHFYLQSKYKACKKATVATAKGLKFYVLKFFFSLNDSASCKYALIIFPWLRVSRLTNPFSFKCTLTANSLFRILTCLTKINLDTKIAIRKRIVNPKIREKKIDVAATDRTGAEGRGYSLRKISVVMAILIQIKLHS